MSNEIVGRIIAFRGEDEYIDATNTLIEVTEIADGAAEIAFNLPRQKIRIYLSVDVSQLINMIVRNGDSK